MIRIIYVLTFFLIMHIKVSAQYLYEDFNKNIPDNWTSNSSKSLSIGFEHYKDGGKSLKWEAKSGDEISAKGLKIPKEETLGHSASEIFVYSRQVSTDTLIFQFLDPRGKLQRQGRMLLNYKGWRSYHRSLQFDYNQGVDQTAFELNECRIIYRSAKKDGTHIIYFDALRFAGNKATRREPAPHTALDKKEFKKIGLAGGNPLESWLNMLPSGMPEITEIEAIDIKKIRQIYKRPLRPITRIELKEALSYVVYANISRNEDKSIRGRGITAIAIPDTLVKISNYCGILARAFLLDNNQEAKDALVLFTEYLIDQGLAEGGRNVLPTNSYHNAKTFPLGFLDALMVYPVNIRAQVLAMLKWSHEYNQIYDENFMPGLNTDFIHLKLETIFYLALSNANDKEVVRDMKYLRRLLENCVSISEGGSDGIKPDGIGFHHLSAHMSYMVAFSSWIEQAHALKGTSFKVSKRAYENMRFGVKTLLLEAANGKMYPHSLSGRKPFTATVPVSKPFVIKLIEIGDDLDLEDNDMKAFYNYIYKENRYPVKNVDLDGFYQFNYAQLGILRKNNWTVAMRGFTDRMFGSEIYDQQNRYGRYQSYGSLEVLYNGNHNETGYIVGGKGWDWNVIPGTTTVHLPWNKLGAKTTTASEYQRKSFAGALSLGKNGIFGFDFVQASEGKYVSDNLTFRKSVFAFDKILVCLGSNINATTAAGIVATNLFQIIAQGKNLPVYVNNEKVADDNYNISLSGTKSTWLINGVNTGYFIPKGNNNIEIIRGEQITPDHTSDGKIKTNRSLASKAWINHGKNPASAKYNFVVVPETNPREIGDLAVKFEDNKIFQILRQTDSAHIVRYIPDNLTSYAFFEPQGNVNIGYVKAISAPALIGIKEEGDLILITIADPDLHAKTAVNSFWRSTESQVTLSLEGNLKVADNKFNAGFKTGNGTSEVTFSLLHGLSNEIILRRGN